ncbi:hypothetical protein MM221_20300 [Salipaludibacillus sp. LMS25]|uniref:hypothetical protein n=1 Tax=Salipaludibacillus sp. LMS25 TaxID=2924031 RepID=UPI0020D1B82C|nr:hypothetical protein [Salipaludibacillus sp. LMS25]UTR17124.1 hypothetical protein MM221_20300 [Salipaludibacillus sp. LMS25]
MSVPQKDSIGPLSIHLPTRDYYVTSLLVDQSSDTWYMIGYVAADVLVTICEVRAYNQK